MLKSFIRGAAYLKKGFLLLNHPEVRFFLLIPTSISLISFGSLTWISFSYLTQFSKWINNWLPSWLGGVTLLLELFAWLIYLIFIGYIFTTVTLFLASPFYGLLAEKVEKLITGNKKKSTDSWLKIVLSIPRSMFREVSKILHNIILACVAICVSFIPLLNIFAPALWFLIGAWIMSISFLDYAMDNNDHRIKEVRKFAHSKLSLTLGFGATVSLFAAIPIVNFFVIPSAVVGATLLWCNNSHELDKNIN